MDTMAESNCRCAAALLLLVWWVSAAAAAAGFSEGCAAPSRFDPLVSNSSLYGKENLPDSIWHDDSWAHRRWGPISRLTMYKAWYYDGAWHNPGEFKGLQAWHGKYYKTEEDRLLFGAKRPHFPYNCTLYRDEAFVSAEIQWDHIMRYMNFTTNRGRYCAWGFPDVAGVSKGVALPPGPNTYIAALRGYEGKPLPPSQGGFKKRYIVQLGFAWAQLKCSNVTQPAAAGNATAVSNATAVAPSSAVLSTAAAAGNETTAPNTTADAAPPAVSPVAAAAGMPSPAITAAPVPSGLPNTILAAAAEAMAAAAAASPSPATAAAAAVAVGASPEPPAQEAPASEDAPSAVLKALASPVPIPAVPLDEATLQASQLLQQSSNTSLAGPGLQPEQQNSSALTAVPAGSGLAGALLPQISQQSSNASVTVPNGAAGSLQDAAVLEQPAANATVGGSAALVAEVQPTAAAAAANTTTPQTSQAAAAGS